MFTIRVSASQHVAYEFFAYEVDFEMLKKLILNEYYITNSIFKNGHKSNINWMQFTNVLILDFDIIITIVTIQRIFEKFKYLIHTTKNHNKLKNNILSERFRLYLPTNDIKLSKEDYRYFMEYFLRFLGADINGKNYSMAFRGYKNCEFYQNNEGILFDCEEHFKVLPARKTKVFKTESKNDFMNKKNWNRMFKPHLIIEGNRNNDFSKYLLWAIDSGCDRRECAEILYWLNDNIVNPLPIKEVDQMLSRRPFK